MEQEHEVLPENLTAESGNDAVASPGIGHFSSMLLRLLHRNSKRSCPRDMFIGTAALSGSPFVPVIFAEKISTKREFTKSRPVGMTMQR